MSTIVVTGASAGVGRATARAFGARGDRVALLARGEDGLNAARREVEEAGGTGLPIPTDVADPDRVEAAAQRVEQELGPIDVWINDAMTTIFAPTWEIAPEEFRRATEVTYLGFVWGTMTALRRMRPRDRGTIVQVGSALAYRGIPLQSAYCGAKHAVEGAEEAVDPVARVAEDPVDAPLAEALQDEVGDELGHVQSFPRRATQLSIPAPARPKTSWRGARANRRAWRRANRRAWRRARG